MGKEEIIKKIDACMERCDLPSFRATLDELLKLTDDENASQELSRLLYEKYTTIKADSLAGMMEIIIRKRPNLAILEFPENYFFRLAVLRGSMDLYECYVEEVIEPAFKGKTEDEAAMGYMELYSVAEKLTVEFFPKFVRCIKGMDFNGAFGLYEKNDNVVLINQEDYEILEDVVEKYNTILGRRDILKDLNIRSGVE